MTNYFKQTYASPFTAKAIHTAKGYLAKAVLYSTGATVVSATIYDSKTAASGNRLYKATLETTDARQLIETWPDGLQFDTGLFLTLAGAGGEIKIEMLLR